MGPGRLKILSVIICCSLFAGCSAKNQLTHVEQTDSVIKYKEGSAGIGRFSNLHPGKKNYAITCQEHCYQPSPALKCKSPAENCRFIGKQSAVEVNTGFTFVGSDMPVFISQAPRAARYCLTPSVSSLTGRLIGRLG